MLFPVDIGHFPYLSVTAAVVSATGYGVFSVQFVRATRQCHSMIFRVFSIRHNAFLENYRDQFISLALVTLAVAGLAVLTDIFYVDTRYLRTPTGRRFYETETCIYSVRDSKQSKISRHKFCEFVFVFVFSDHISDGRRFVLLDVCICKSW